MDEPAIAGKAKPQLDRRALLILRAATSLFLLLSLAMALIIGKAGAGFRANLLEAAALVSFFLYAAVLRDVQKTPPGKLGLRLAMVLGSLWTSLLLILALIGTVDAIHGDSSPLSLLLNVLLWGLAILQGVYGYYAHKAHRVVAPGSRFVRLLLFIEGTCFASFLLLVVVGWVIVNMSIHGVPDTPSPVGSLRTIITAEITYASTYNKGYSSRLADLAPPAPGEPDGATSAGLIDSVLASGTQGGYRFEYQPGPRDENGWIDTYTVCARPLDRKRNPNSYFTDESGVIRITGEDRCPTVRDLAIAG